MRGKKCSFLLVFCSNLRNLCLSRNEGDFTKSHVEVGCPFFASNKKMQNDAKRSEKDAKINSKQVRGSETKQNKVSLL
jgi:hypothetical protein